MHSWASGCRRSLSLSLTLTVARVVAAPQALHSRAISHLRALTHLLQAFAGVERAVSATIEWVDIAGLAKGASRGEGLGNKFLGTARDCDALCLNLTLTLTTDPDSDY